MAGDAERLHDLDTEAHKDRAWIFWAVSTTLTAAMLLAVPPTWAIGTTAGWAIAGAGMLASWAYVIRLVRTRGRVSRRETFLSCLFGACLTANAQWLQGGYRSPIVILFALQVFGAAAILTGRARGVHLAIVLTFVLVPLAYGPTSAVIVITAVVFAIILAIQAGFLLEYGLRLRAQRLTIFEAEREASARAVTDELTGLGNRRALACALREAADRVAAGASVTIVYTDLDGFKPYNDRLGHAAGDALLHRFGGALREALSGRGQAFRIGGDEFCALLDGALAPDDPAIAAVREALTEPGPDLAVTPSCGVVTVPAEVADVPGALRLADERMYAAKHNLRPSLAQELVDVLHGELARADDVPVDPWELARTLAVRAGVPAAEAEALLEQLAGSGTGLPARDSIV